LVGFVFCFVFRCILFNYMYVFSCGFVFYWVNIFVLVLVHVSLLCWFVLVRYLLLFVLYSFVWVCYVGLVLSILFYVCFC